MTGDFAVVFVHQLGHLVAATIIGVGAARMKVTSARRMNRIRHLSRYRNTVAARHIEIADRLQQHPCVRLPGLLEQRALVAPFAHAPPLHAAAEVGPALLGADGPRRYFVAFTNPAEARGQSGLMGNWSELTIDEGRIELTDTGRTAVLDRGIDNSDPIFLDMPEEYFDRYRSEEHTSELQSP